MPWNARALISIVLIVLMPVIGRAQTTSTLLGAVRDTSDGVLPGVSITVKHFAPTRHAPSSLAKTGTS